MTTPAIEDLAATLRDPVKRISSGMYKIKSEDTGAIIPFYPRPLQRLIIEAVHHHGYKFLIIIKSRRQGFSTAINVLLEDFILWINGFQASIVDLNQKSAQYKMRNIVHVAWDNLPKSIRSCYTETARSSGELTLTHNGTGTSPVAPSSINAGLKARGGTNHALHISEWGKIQATDTERSKEILTGAIPSARQGIKIVETTWEGGKRGELYNLVKQALETPDEQKGPHDPRVYFFPWWQDPGCNDPAGYIDDESAELLRQTEKLLLIEFPDEFTGLTDGQRRFYARQRRDLGIFIYREYPSTLEEALRAPVEGAVYAPYLAKQRARRMVAPFEVSTIYPVHTAWDLGAPVNSPVWFFQMADNEIVLVDFDQGTNDEDLTRRIARFREKGYPLGTAYLPHDARPAGKTGHSFEDSLKQAGLTTTAIVPRRPAGPSGIWEGINRAWQLFPTFRFRLPATEAGIMALENYRHDPDKSEEPIHDWSSHAADALRTLAEADLHGLLPRRGPNTPQTPTHHHHHDTRPRIGLR